jgi:Ca2+-transporting ATPase
MTYYREEVQDVLERLGSSLDGLSGEEAGIRLLKNGKNKLAEAKKTPLLVRFFRQLADPMVIILLAAAAVSAATAIYSGERGGITDVAIILAVVLINALLGVFQENKAEKSIEALQKMSAATSRVLRGGHVVSINSEDLVAGDVVLLEAGDAVPADGRIVESASLKIEEAALTGESVPVDKVAEAIRTEGEAPLGDRKNMVYMGGTVVYGRGKAVITEAGMDTEMGKIADALSRAEAGDTPLQKKLGKLSRTLSLLVIGICLFIFVFSLFRAGEVNGRIAIDTFMVAVSLAVAAIPEGLAAVVTIVLSIGVTNMSRRSAIIRKLTAVETLGCAQIICSDKTGTLTQNKMTVTEAWGGDTQLLAEALALCSDSELDENNEASGEPTENALVNYAFSLGISKTERGAALPRVGEAPFDSVRKLMSTLHRDGTRLVQYTKGAPDELLKLCTHLLENGRRVPLTDLKRDEISAQNKKMAGQALRVLAGAFREHADMPKNLEPARLETELTFIGLVGMIDPVRPEVADAISKCRTAGIIPIMITGDHRDTAVAIASQLGIISDERQAITGTQLSEIPDDRLWHEIEKYRVYARVQPEHKVRIVKAWRDKGFVTAMTGDGVNDAPSIKNADIGVGMGITGTDVTKNAADMVLADDNFATIVGAVEEGRRIYDNIRKAIQFLLASNMSEVLSIFLAALFGFTILRPIHLLWINLITDTFPALALGVEPAEPNIMGRPPRGSSEGVFSGGAGVDILYQGAAVTAITLTAYLAGHFIETGAWGFADSSLGVTMAFLAMSMAEIFHSFNMRSRRGSIFLLNRQNGLLWGAALTSLVATLAVIYLPSLASAFHLQRLTAVQYGLSMALAFCIIPVVEAVKLAQRLSARASKR